MCVLCIDNNVCIRAGLGRRVVGCEDGSRCVCARSMYVGWDGRSCVQMGSQLGRGASQECLESAWSGGGRASGCGIKRNEIGCVERWRDWNEGFSTSWSKYPELRKEDT